MTEAGLRVVLAAKRDGSWKALDDIDALIVPVDLAQELARKPVALRRFEATSESQKKAILWWVKSAKLPATRARRIAETAIRLAAGPR